MAMVLSDMLPVPDPEAMTEFVLWIWWCAALGLGVNLGVQLLLSPGDPLLLLRRALVERLRTVEAVVRSLGSRAGGPSPPRPSLTSLTIAGTSEMLTLLKMASFAMRGRGSIMRSSEPLSTSSTNSSRRGGARGLGSTGARGGHARPARARGHRVRANGTRARGHPGAGA
jgi:hypothetical protein